MHKLSEEAKQMICKPLGISVDEKDEKIIEAYIEHIDNEPIGHTDRLFARENSMCSFPSAVDKSIDYAIKQNLKKHKKAKLKAHEDVLCK